MFKLILENPARLLAFLVSVAFLAVLVSQVLIPMIRDTQYFPMFRKRSDIVHDIKRAKEDRDAERLAHELEQTEAETALYRKRREEQRQKSAGEPRFEQTAQPSEPAGSPRRSPGQSRPAPQPPRQTRPTTVRRTP